MQPLPLRNVSVKKQAVIQYSCLQNVPIAFIQPEAARRYICLAARGDDRNLTVYCTGEALLEACQLTADVFPQQLIDEGLLAQLAVGFFSQNNHAGPFVNGELKQISYVATVTGAEIANELVSFAQGLHLAWYQLSDLTLPTYRKPAAAEKWRALPLKLELQLGYTLLAKKELSRLKAGDVLLMQCIREVARIGQQEIYKLRLEGDDMHIEQTGYDINKMEGEAEENAFCEDYPLENIEVKVDFIAGEKMLTIGQLNQITVGDVITLAKSRPETRQVFLVVQNKRVATGEMVLLDDQFAVEITHVQGAPASE
ncbi:hypothetical protein BTJ39_03590 [Izhakiella australiensis]|uniref:Uncharacterized protein n=1 Tax=Izhakiella australiensis TaxID=1926881 RepID=A0A1S8YR09_9GAMM|nr:FliM/FliN family flagellar motor switch protein [Izhakiella australiensis]OON41063.1 hypothetical protein BTJ39_03590 [Izhakiella australiensis]